MSGNANANGAVVNYPAGAASSSPWQRRKTWDLTHLSTKYPWLRVDEQTLDEFRSPFQWVHERDLVADSGSDSESGDASSHEDHEPARKKGIQTKKKKPRGRDTRYSLAKHRNQPTAHRQGSSVSPRKRKRSQSMRLDLHHAIGINHTPMTSQAEVPPLITQLQTARSETDDKIPTKASLMTPQLLPASVLSDLQTLKLEQRQRNLRKHKPVKAHNILSLSLPALHKPLPKKSSAAVREASLSHQLELVTKQELALQQRVAQQIAAEKAKLPLTFLFERNLDKTYCKQKCVATITSIFAKLQHRMMFYAFQRWLSWVDVLVEQERREAAIQNAQKKALAFFERLASDAYVGTIDRAFKKWLENARQLAVQKMQVAAVKIQTLYRQRKARGLLKDLKQASMDREYKRNMEIQRLLRFESYGTAMKWSTLRNGFNLLLLSICAKRIQYFFRRIRTRKRVARRQQHKQAAVRIQCRWRIKLARKRLSILRKARQIQLAREQAASVHIQRRTRGYLARQHAALRRLHLSQEHIRASVLQRAWRRYCDRKRLKERFKRRRELLDEERARLEELARIEAARQNELRRDEIAVHIQRVVRGFMGRREAQRRRYARDLERAARGVQLSWRKSKGRYALHLRFLAQKDKITMRRNAAVLLLQCQVRRLRAKRQRDEILRQRQQRRASAVAIQRVFRGRQARQEYQVKRRSTVTIQCAWRSKQARQERDRRVQEKLLLEQQRYAATLKLQSVARGHKARRLTRQLRHEQQQLEMLLQQSAVLIQKRARGMEARKVAVLLKQAMQVVDLQQRRAYSNSTQHKVIQSPLLAFLTSQYMNDTGNSSEEEPVVYTREQQQWIQWQIDYAKQQMAREDAAIVLMQRHYRGYRTRVQFVVLQIQRRNRLALENRMALKIQRVARGFLARRRVHKLKAKKRGDAIKEAYIQERKWKEQERAFQEQYKQEQMALQLQRLQTLEKQMKDAKREAEIAKWQAEAAASRKQELEAQLEAKKLERALRRRARGLGEEEDEDDEGEEVLDPAWEYVTDAYGNGYYYNATTGESSWEKPAVVVVKPPSPSKKKAEKKKSELKKPFVKPEDNTKPSTSETTTGKTEQKPQVETVAQEGFCTKCKAVKADKECLDCLSSDLFSACLYCSACFILEHGLVGSKTHHDFKVLKPLQLPSRCQQAKCVSETQTSPDGIVLPKSKTPASYYCQECPSDARFSCEACFPVVHESAQTSHHIPTSLHFRAGSLLCVECQNVLATRHCSQCDEAFCACCFDGLHDPNAIYTAKKDHEFTALQILKDDLTSERDSYCVECEIKRCTRLCNPCGDGFCELCFIKAHAKGQKTLHTWISWDSFAAHGDWLEILDAKSGKTVFFNIETKESTHVQPFVMKSGEERHRVLFQEREAGLKKKALELESEIVKLKEQVVTLEQENEKVKEKDKKRRTGLDDDTDATASDESKRPKRGLLSGLFGRKQAKAKEEKKKKVVAPPPDQKLTPDEYKRLALQRSVQQKPEEMALINSKLKTRDREQKEEAAKRTVGTKLFEQAMIEQLASASDAKT